MLLEEGHGALPGERGGGLGSEAPALRFAVRPTQVVFLAREGAVGARALHAFIDGLNDDEKAHLTAIAWVGRGAFEPEEYQEAVRTAYTEATTPTEDYLMGMPHLAENLEAGLEALEIDITEIETDFL
mgnify:CR=1 FL=1